MASTLIDTQQHNMSRSDRIKKATCQLYNTYLPESYLPFSCENYLEEESSWAWSMINTVFVGSITIFNTTILIIITFLWLVNRQFHFSKKRHSYDKEPLKTPAKLLRLSKAKLKKAAKKLKRKKSLAQIHQEEKESEAAKLLAEQKKHKSFQSFLDIQDCDEEEDEDDTVLENSLDMQHKKQQQPYRSTTMAVATGINNTRPPLGLQLSPNDIAKKKRTKDLLQLASKIEVFSYLSPDAVIDILEYVEYVDFKNIGDVVFDTHTLDGSMYAVVSGEVTTSLSVEETGNKEDFSFVAAPGEVITSMLSIVTSLVREYQLQDELIHLFNGTGVGGSIGVGQVSSNDEKKVFIPPGMNIQAIVTASNTRLLRIPSRCFVAILEKFPLDVHNICQTILSRLQRVTIQTLVRFLGLDAGILGVGGPSLSSSDGNVPIKPLRNSTVEWSKLEQSLLSGSSDTSTASSILEEATSAAASLLGMTADTSHELNEGAEIIHASSGSVICSKGQPLDGIYLILKGSLEVGLDQSKQQQGGTPEKASQERVVENQKKATRSKRVSTLSSGSSRSFSSFDEQDENSSFKPLFSAAPGNWVGLFSCFTKDASFITAHATNGALLLKIPAKTFHAVVSKYPRVLIHTLLDIIDTVGNSNNFCVTPSMFLLDMSLDWMHVEAGEYIVLQGEPCDSMFVVLNGRLRAEGSTSKDDTKAQSRSNEEYGRGATVGELEALAEGMWTQSLYAIRHVEVARIPAQIINILMAMFPLAGMHFAKVIATQIHSRSGQRVGVPKSLLPSYELSLATIAVVPLDMEVNVSDFSSYLTNSLSNIAPTKLLTKKETKERVGAEYLKHRNTMLKVKMTRILGDVEENNRLVVYESDYKYTWWTKLCVQQADCVLLLVDSRQAPELNRVEELLAWANEKKNVRVELVVVQSSAAQEKENADEHASDNLNNWSEQRPWITKQHLVRCAFSDHVQDFRRMTRRIAGQSIGLVLESPR